MSSESTKQPFEVIIGLEIHVQLRTESKLFCGCSTKFGAPPNTQTCHVCTGMPGALPVLNRHALELAIKTGLALNCQIERATKWDRKNYFYPDLPKGYQISQFDRPICFEGVIDVVDNKGVATGKQVRNERAHLEEDAGKSTHDESGQGGVSKIDLNRTGTPLLEIVTMPDMQSAEQAKDFLTELKLILTYIDVSDCNMQEGSLRVDANVNLLVDKEQELATPIVEIKNLNSFRAVQRAIEFEVERQWKLYQETGQTKEQAPKQTRGWDDQRQVTTLQREKEDSADYRYFPDPDLVSIHTTDETIEKLRSELGQLPADIRNQLNEEYQLAAYDVDVLSRQGRAVVQFFRECESKVGNAKLVSNWIQQEVLRYLNENEIEMEGFPLSAEHFCELLQQVADNKLDQSRGKEVFNLMVEAGCTVEQARDKLGIVEIDNSEVESICRKLMEDNPIIVADVQSGNAKAIGSLIGQARQINSSVNPKLVREMLLKLISAAD